MTVCACFAQRRPERQPRRHDQAVGRDRRDHRLRSTKAGASAPATQRPAVASARAGKPSLNEGRSVSPGDTRDAPHGPRQLLERSTKAGASAPATPETLRERRRGQSALNEGRSVSPGDTSVMLSAPFATMSAQRRPERQPRRHRPVRTRRPRRIRALNEGRSVSPGDTAKFCKRAVSGQTIARPRAREPRRRRVCGHFTRFRTIPRQNGQDQAVETALTAAEHTRFPRITEGSQMSQSTQGWPSS